MKKIILTIIIIIQSCYPVHAKLMSEENACENLLKDNLKIIATHTRNSDIEGDNTSDLEFWGYDKSGNVYYFFVDTHIITRDGARLGLKNIHTSLHCIDNQGSLIDHLFKN